MFYVAATSMHACVNIFDIAVNIFKSFALIMYVTQCTYVLYLLFFPAASIQINNKLIHV